MLQSRSSFDRTGHCLVGCSDISGGILFHAGVILRDICVLGKTAAKLRLIASICWLTSVLLLVLLLLLLRFVFILGCALVRVCVLILAIVSGA